VKKLTMTIPEEVHKKLKLLAIQEERTMASIVIDCIEARYDGVIDLPKPKKLEATLSK
jgi:predicted DNA-binding protein